MSKSQKKHPGRVKAFLVGGGIASLAAAVSLIRHGGVPGENITLFEEDEKAGGSLDAAGSREEGYTMRGGRMFEKHFACTFDLLEGIPSVSDPKISAKQELIDFHRDYSWNDKARLVENGRPIDSSDLGLSERDRLDLAKLVSLPEMLLGGKRIDECFFSDFFRTNFWFMWCTTFAFEPWHSACEFRRYLLRFIHLLPSISTMSGIYRTRYNQYDAIVVPVVNWLKEKGVHFRYGCQVLDLGITLGEDEKTVETIYYLESGLHKEVNLGPDDLVFVTNGSMTAESTLGSMHEPAELKASRTSGSWLLWEKLAKKHPNYGRPSAFNGHIDDTKWESFTVTDKSPRFFEFMQEFSGSEAGRGGLITLKDSNWLLTIVLNHQPHFVGQPEDVFIWWGYGLFPDQEGNFVRKAMADCSGEEILREVLGHLRYIDGAREVISTSNVIPCMMPYITSQFMPRVRGDRPDVVPPGSRNMAFIGQYCEMPDDVVFTVEYSVRSARIAVDSLMKLNQKIPPVFKGQFDPAILLQAVKTLHRGADLPEIHP